MFGGLGGASLGAYPEGNEVRRADHGCQTEHCGKEGRAEEKGHAEDRFQEGLQEVRIQEGHMRPLSEGSILYFSLS